MDANVYRAALDGSWERLMALRWHNQVTLMGDTVLHVHLRRAIEKGKVNVEFIRYVIDQEAQGGMQSLLWAENENGEIPLHLAARFGHVEVVREFLQRVSAVKEDDVREMLRKTNKKKDTALHEAARGGHDQVVQLLAQSGPSCPHEANDANETPLYLAAESGIAACVAVILNTCASHVLAYDHRGPCGRTALHASVQWEDPEIMSAILEEDVSLARLKDDEGSAPLHLVVTDDKIEQLRVLLTYDMMNNESTTYIRDKEGRTPLHIATLYLGWHSIHELIKHRPDSIDIVDNRGQNVLHYAANWACLNKFKLFLELDNSLNKLMDEKDFDGNTPMHLVAANVPYIKCPCTNGLQRFIDVHHRCLNSFNNENLTAADILASYGKDDFIINSKPRISVGRTSRRVTVRGRNALRKSKAKAEDETETAKDIRKRLAASQNQIVVAALVATVSFAAGVTVPGGFNQNPGDPDIGTAVLAKRTAFKAFFVSDTIALTFSCLAVLLYFRCTIISITRTWLVGRLLTVARECCRVSIGAMMVAFVTGAYAVVPHFPDLHIALFIVTAFFFLYYVPNQLIQFPYWAWAFLLLRIRFCTGLRIPRRLVREAERTRINT